MSRILPLLRRAVLAGLLLGSGAAAAQESAPPIPDPAGRAGMAAAADGAGGILAAGGANFPGADPWTATKTYHPEIWRLHGGAWHPAGTLPEPLAYAAFGAWHGGLVLAGGCHADGHSAHAYLLTPGGADGRVAVRPLPDLPEPLAYAAGCVGGDTFFVIGGQTAPDAVPASDAVWALDLAATSPAWRRAGTIPGGGRILSGAGVKFGRIHLFGGCSLAAGADGVRRTYLDACASLDPATAAWRPEAPLPAPLAAMAAPAAVVGEYLVLVGGDDGGHHGRDPRTHPGQRRDILAYDRLHGRWERWGEAPEGVATAPLVRRGGTLMVVGGELRPRIRTAATACIPVREPVRLTWLDGLTGMLGLAALGLLVFAARRQGRRGVAAAVAGDGRTGFHAWLVVALLWFVVMLNYLDRQVLASMRDPVRDAIPQSDFQFGLLTGLFLFIYAACSPLGGWLADRFSRRLVMLGSLLLWSLATWLTGHAKDYQQLLLFRAAMGVSEACYIPAALAYITDLHGGRTRSLATGLHQSGIYAGKALAGVGGALAVAVGWRTGFSILGFVGVAYALVLLLAMREPGGHARTGAPPAPAAPTAPPRRADFRRPAFLMLVAIVGLSGMANWFIMGWLPTLLQEKFHLSLAKAGLAATLPTTVANYAAALAGGFLADRWAARHPRGRAWLAGIGFGIGGPVLAACLFAGPVAGALGLSPLVVFIACVAAQAVAQGLMDATLMPILRDHVDGRRAATGYGLLNFVSAGLGGAFVVFGGAIKDRHLDPVAVLAAGGAGLFACGLLFFLLPRPTSA